METVRRELEPWLVGRTILRACRVEAPPGPKYARLEEAAGGRIEAVRRRGKFLLLPLSRPGVVEGADEEVDGEVHEEVDAEAGEGAGDGAGGAGDGRVRHELVIHLGMTGIVSATPPERHERVRLHLDGDEPATLHFRDARRFGRFLLLPAGDHRSLPTLAALGPEPLSDDFHEAAFARALKRSRQPIKSFLLSQRPVAGVGNIYADEALWRARVHPLTPASRVARRRVGALREAIREVLAASIEAQGTTLSDYRTVNGEAGAFGSFLDAYGRAEEPCGRCGELIRRIVVAGRGTHYCPGCQKRR